MVVGLFIQFAAIRTNITEPAPCSPWVRGGNWPAHFDDGLRACANINNYTATDLSLTGALYMSLRGLDTFLALALAATIAAAWFRGMRLDVRKIADFSYPGLGPNQVIRRLGTALLLCVVLANIVAALQGLTLALHAREMLLSRTVSRARQVDLFIESTWPIWALLTIIISSMAIAIVLRLRASVISELRRLQEDALSKLQSFASIYEVADADLERAGKQLGIADKLLDLRLKPNEDFLMRKRGRCREAL